MSSLSLSRAASAASREEKRTKASPVLLPLLLITMVTPFSASSNPEKTPDALVTRVPRREGGARGRSVGRPLPQKKCRMSSSVQAKGRPRSRTACESGVSEDAFFRRPSASPFVTSYTEEGGKNEAKSTRTTFSKPLTRLCPVSVEGKPNCSFFFPLHRTFHVARTEVLPVLLQRFAHILLMLHLHKGTSRRPPLVVRGQVHARQAVADPTVWIHNRDSRHFSAYRIEWPPCASIWARKIASFGFFSPLTLPEKKCTRSRAVHDHGRPITCTMYTSFRLAGAVSDW